MVQSLHLHLKNCNKLLFIFWMFFLSVVVTVVFSPLFELLDTASVQTPTVEYDQAPGAYEFFTAVIIAPLVETIIFQFLIIEFLYMTNMGKRKIVVLSAILFASIHYYSVGYVFFAFTMGLILSYSYVIQGSTAQAFLIVYVIHLLRNALTFILRLFEI